MKQNWEIKKLGEVCDFQNGFAFKSKTFKARGIPIIRITNIQDEKLNLSKIVYIDPKDYEIDLSRYEIGKGDLLIAMSGATTGKIGIHKTDEKLLLNQRVGKFSPKPVLNKSFLFNFLSTKVEESLAISAGAAQPNLSTEQIKCFEIPIPTLPEQKRIVTILDKAFAAIAKAKANAEQNLNNAKELFESYLQGLFENKNEGWEEKKLSEVCEITSKLIDPKTNKYQNLVHIGAGNIESKKGTLIDLKTAKEEKLISGKFLFDETMVLYSKIRPYLMKIVKCEFKGLCSADIYPLAPLKDIITQSFLYYLLSSNHFTEYAIEGSQRAGMPKVNRKHLFDYSFLCPSVQVQRQIVKKLSTLSVEALKLEAIYQQKTEDLEELKKTVLQKAFNGELKTSKEIAV